MAGSLGILIYRRLRERYVVELGEFIAPRLRGRNLFEFMVGVMLSQNTSDKNAIRAYNALREALGEITPEKILELGEERLAEIIRPAGMYRARARNIVGLARRLRGRGLVELDEKLGRLGVEEARRILVGLPGIGAKTADVILLMYYGKPTFPVDTHIRRITRRLGVVERDRYEDIRGWWMSQLPPDKYLEAHLLLITHGRRTCRARGPMCDACPLRDLCRYASERRGHSD